MTIRDVLYLVAFVLLIGHMQQRDEKEKPAPVSLILSVCAEKDYLGRSLVASYYARSDRMQTMRCTYRKLWT